MVVVDPFAVEEGVVRVTGRAVSCSPQGCLVGDTMELGDPRRGWAAIIQVSADTLSQVHCIMLCSQ